MKSKEHTLAILDGKKLHHATQLAYYAREVLVKHIIKYYEAVQNTRDDEGNAWDMSVWDLYECYGIDFTPRGVVLYEFVHLYRDDDNGEGGIEDYFVECYPYSQRNRKVKDYSISKLKELSIDTLIQIASDFDENFSLE